MSSAPLWGVQMFIRERAGIEAFEALVEQGRKDWPEWPNWNGAARFRV
jgi:hypothetical protein